MLNIFKSYFVKVFEDTINKIINKLLSYNKNFNIFYNILTSNFYFICIIFNYKRFLFLQILSYSFLFFSRYTIFGFV
jgi:hypothetical protein